MLPNREFLLLISYFFVLFSLSSEAYDHVLTLDYVPMASSYMMGGAGIGMCYEERVNDFFSARGGFSFSYYPAENNGHISLSIINASAVFFPFHSAPEGLYNRLGTGLIYLAAQGEDHYGGLESYFLIPFLENGTGWRFCLGEGKLRFIFMPEINVTLVLPGNTASGPKDQLQWKGTGIMVLACYPNLIMGVNY